MAISLTIALMRYFGKKENQTLADFAKEVRALKQQDKEDLKQLLEAEMKTEINIEAEQHDQDGKEEGPPVG